jgi:hypothetical protein
VASVREAKKSSRCAGGGDIHWRQRQPNRCHVTLTDHLGHFVEDHHRRAIRAVTAKRFPS